MPMARITTDTITIPTGDITGARGTMVTVGWRAAEGIGTTTPTGDMRTGAITVGQTGLRGSVVEGVGDAVRAQSKIF